MDNNILDAKVRLVPWARLHWDEVRKSYTILAPERVIHIGKTAEEIIRLLDGERSVRIVVSLLTARYKSNRIESDVVDFVGRFTRAGILQGYTAPSVNNGLDTPSTAQNAKPQSDVVQPAVVATMELTYRCPLQCSYCSNPEELENFRDELAVDVWKRTLFQAKELGILQVHFSGGEPLLYRGLPELVAYAKQLGLYTNLITSAYGLSESKLGELVSAGIDHVQVSFQDVNAVDGDAIAGTTAHEQKLVAAKLVRQYGLALSINVVLHRRNTGRLAQVIELAEQLDAQRLELATVQLHGWALRNRLALLPTKEQCTTAETIAREAQRRLSGKLQILYVLPDYYTERPKPCMDGWAKRFMTIAPNGNVLPCPGAHVLPWTWPNVTTDRLQDIWYNHELFNRFRGTSWMSEPCRTCDKRKEDHGGCRCQAYALTKDAWKTDPTCKFSLDHHIVEQAREETVRVTAAESLPMVYRIRTRKSADQGV